MDTGVAARTTFGYEQFQSGQSYRWSASDGRGQSYKTEKPPALAAPANLQAAADDDDVHRPTHHRRRFVFRHAAPGVVAGRRRGWAQCLRAGAVVHGDVARTADP